DGDEADAGGTVSAQGLDGPLPYQGPSWERATLRHHNQGRMIAAALYAGEAKRRIASFIAPGRVRREANLRFLGRKFRQPAVRSPRHQSRSVPGLSRAAFRCTRRLFTWAST